MLRHAFSTLVVLSVVLFAARSVSAEIAVERTDEGARVKIDGQLFAEYLVKSGNKPILWPVIGPTGEPMTRAYPMREVHGEKQDHVHQRSLWFTFGNVNGIDFWAEEASKRPGSRVGTIKHLEFVKLASGKPAVLVARNAWLAPDGKQVCEDERTLRFDADDQARWIDFDITLKATNGPVTFGDTKEGAFGVRVAETMTVDANRGGRIVNSEGQVDADAWGKAAAWVDYHGPLADKTVGIAILNHPTSFYYPTFWHVRTYGLFAANPFRSREFTGSGDGTFPLPAGEAVVLRYRVLLHRGDETTGRIAERFAQYSEAN